MSREFKFRCYDKNEEYMLPWKHLVQAGDLSEMLLHGHEEDVDYSKLMQFTGLQDKDGVEIYEGDILTSEEYPYQDASLYNYHGIVEYSEDMAAFVIILKVVNPKRRGISDGIAEYFGAGEIFEIIGNIYEHPHLLKGGETDAS